MIQKEKNTILLLFDQFISIDKLPPVILNKLKGIQYLKSKGVLFNNIRNNRQMCSPSRSTIFTSKINHGIQDNIDQNYQYTSIPQVNEKDDTIAKSLKRNKVNICGYYGKDHIISKENYEQFNLPETNINSNGTMRQYGFDSNNLYGDSYYLNQKGYLADSMYFNTIVNNNIENYDFKNIDGLKFCGALPFLQSRAVDGQTFHLQFHLTNPHDTQEYWQNLSQIPRASRLQYWTPFLNEQTTKKNIDNPYIFNEYFKDAFATDKELTTNFFEKIYEQYKNNKFSLPNLSSFVEDYCTASILNSNDGTLVSFYELYKQSFTMPDNKDDIESWKNLINNYFGLLLLSDNYLFSIINFLEESGLIDNTSIILTSDHGEQLGAHGLKQKYVHYDESQRTDIYVFSKDIDKEYIGNQIPILGSSIDINPTIESLANIKNISPEFLGKSLFEKNEEGFLIPRKKNINSFNVCNAVMMSNAYITFQQWYDVQPPLVIKKVVNIPENIGLFKYNYISSTIIYLDQLWKITKYFNLDALLIYNFKNKPDLLNPDGSQIKFSEIQLLGFLSNKESIENKKTINKLFLFLFSGSNELTLLQILNLINEYSKNDTDIRILFYLIVFNIITQKLNNILYLPGVLGESFQSQYKNPNLYYYYVTNLTSDKDEVLNLTDPKNYNVINDEIFEYLNNEQQQLISQNRCKNFYFIPPKISILSLLYFINISSLTEIPKNLNKKDQFLLMSFYSNNNFDTSSNTYIGLDKISLLNPS
jgi:arylsulfatase A-like enzyme